MLKGLEKLKELLSPKDLFISECRQNNLEIADIFDDSGVLETIDPSAWENISIKDLGFIPSEKKSKLQLKAGEKTEYSSGLTFSNDNLESHFEKHKDQIKSADWVGEYEQKILGFVKKFENKLRPEYIIYPKTESNRVTNEKQLRLILQDLITQDILVITQDQSDMTWRYTTFFKKDLVNLKQESELVSSVNYYQKLLSSGLYKNEKTIDLINECLFRAKNILESRRVQNSIMEIRSAENPTNNNITLKPNLKTPQTKNSELVGAGRK